MVTFTNTCPLPDPLAAECSDDDYDRGECDASVSELAGPSRIAVLRRQHDHERVEDVADRLFMVFGKLMHLLLERRAGSNVLTEERLMMQLGSFTLSGKLDHYTLDQAGLLTDWKYTTKYSAIGKLKKDWEAQLNGYAMLLREHGFPVTTARVCMVLRDWSLEDPNRDRDLPHYGYAERAVPLWEDKVARSFFQIRMALLSHVLAGTVELPLCTPEERWQDPPRWAAKKPEKTKATRVFGTLEEAQEFVKSKGDGLRVEERPSIPKHCVERGPRSKSYCPVTAWCDWFQAYKTAGQAGEESEP